MKILKKEKKFKRGDRVHYGGGVIDDREITAILKTIQEGNGANWTVGKKGVEFEGVLSSYTKHKYVTLTNSGSSALLLALVALNLPKDSLVMIPATCFPTAYSAIIYAGYKPLVVDSDPDSFNIDLEAVSGAFQRLGRDIKAVIAVNIAGNIPDLDFIRGLCRTYGAKLVLDNCDGFGGKYKGKPVEYAADVACTSFHAAHIISMGEGGAVFTSDHGVADRVKQLRDWGREDGTDKPTTIKSLPKGYPRRYSYPVLGFNLKPLELQAAMGIVQFKKMEKFKKMRANNWNALLGIFGKYPNLFATKVVTADADPCWFSFPVSVLGDKSKFVQWMEKHNIETRPIFAGNITKHTASLKTVGTFDGADFIMEHGMFIGCSPRTTKEMIGYIEKVVDEYARKES